MKSFIQSIAISLLTIAIGVAWLLNTMGILPGVNWLWTGALGVTGILVLALGGINKLTIVTGPFLIIASIFSILRQTGRVDVNHEVPMLVIVLGFLMLLSQLLRVPAPGWMQQPMGARKPSA